MTIPGTFKRSPALKEIEHLTVGPDELLILKFAESVKQDEMVAFAQQLEGGPLRGRTLCMKFDGEIMVVEK